MGIHIQGKSKSQAAKEAMKIASLLASFKFERGDYYTETEGNILSNAIKVLTKISNRT